MNVLFYCISDNPANDGVSRVTNILASAFPRHGMNVFLCHWEKSRTAADTSFYTATLCERGFDEAGIRRVLSFMGKHDIDVFVNPFTSNLIVHPLLRAIRKRTSARLVTVFHGNPLWYETFTHFHRDFKWPEWLKRNLFKIYKSCYMRPKIKRMTCELYKLSDAYVLLSEHFRKDFLDYNRRIKDDSKLYAINNPANVTVNDVPEADKEKLMLYVGRLENGEKRVDRILEIWRRFHKPGDGWRLELVGDGRHRGLLEAMAKEMRLSDIAFRGFSDNVNDYYRRARVLLLTSATEGFSMVIIEGETFGVVPVVMNTFSSLQDIITDGENGFMVNPDDFDAFVACLRKVEADFPRMSALALASVKRFSVDVIVERWKVLFIKLLGADRPGGITD